MSEIKDMTIEEVEVRTSEIQAEVDSADETRLAELKTELDSLEERKAELKKMATEAKETREAVAEGKVDIEEVQTVIQEERKMTNAEVIKSAEYRDAFKSYILTGKDTECRALLTENVASGTVPVPELVSFISSFVDIPIPPESYWSSHHIPFSGRTSSYSVCHHKRSVHGFHLSSPVVCDMIN